MASGEEHDIPLPEPINIGEQSPMITIMQGNDVNNASPAPALQMAVVASPRPERAVLQPVVPPEDHRNWSSILISEFIQRKKQIAALVMIFAIVISFSLWDAFEEPKYCSPEDFQSLKLLPQIGPSNGAVSLRSVEFIEEDDDLILKVKIRNNGKALSSPKLRLYYYNPADETPGEKLVEVSYHLKECKGPLGSGPHVLLLRFPFPFEDTLQMAIEAKVKLYMKIECENSVVLSKHIPIPPHIIFHYSWVNHLAGRTIRVVIFGEQGSAKSTAINDFLNLLQGWNSRINFTPPSITIEDSGTIGVAKVSVTTPLTALDRSIVFYDTEGAQQGRFLLPRDLKDILMNPPKVKYLARSHFKPTEGSDTCTESSDIEFNRKLNDMNLKETNGTVSEVQTHPDKTEACSVTANNNNEEYTSSSHIPLNLEENIDFVLYTINANSLSPNEDGETIIDESTLASYTTVVRAVSSYNEKYPHIAIQPIKLITFGNLRAKNVSTWVQDKEAQDTLEKLVNMNLGGDPNPTLVYQTSHALYQEEDKIYLIQSMAKLMKEMIYRIPVLKPTEIEASDSGSKFYAKFRSALFSMKTWDLIKYLHGHLFWFLSCFFIL